MLGNSNVGKICTVRKVYSLGRNTSSFCISEIGKEKGSRMRKKKPKSWDKTKEPTTWVVGTEAEPFVVCLPSSLMDFSK